MPYYAVRVGHVPGIYATWAECQAQTVRFSGAQFKKFDTHDAAVAFMAGDVALPVRPSADRKAIAVDGTHNGTTGPFALAQVTDTTGQNLVHIHKDLFTDFALVHDDRHIQVRFGDHVQQNNGAELAAMVAGLRIALRDTSIREIWSDSSLIVDYWSLGRVADATKALFCPAKLALVNECCALRAQFEASGGKIVKISGSTNPADFGFHR